MKNIPESELKPIPMQLFICANSEHGYKNRDGNLYHVIASDGTFYYSYGSSNPFFAFHDLIGDRPGLRKHLDSVYGKHNWKIKFLWEQDQVTFKDINKLVKAKYKTFINKTYIDKEYKKASDNINETLRFTPNFNDNEPKKKVKKRDQSWWNGTHKFYVE